MANYQILSGLSLFVCFLALPAAGQDEATPNGRALSFDLSASSFVQPPEAEPDTAAPGDEEESIEYESAGDNGWQFSLAPYFWAMSLRTSVDGEDVSGTSEVCVIDLLEELDGAVQLRFEGLKNNRWGFYIDGNWLRLSNDDRMRGVDVNIQITEAWVDFGGMLRLGEPGCTFDVMLAARYSYLNTELSIGPFNDRENTSEAVAPIIGGRWQFGLSDKWLMSIKGDIGGFGVEDAADLTWGVTGLVGFEASDKLTLVLGYRLYQADFNDGPIDYEIQYHGPMVGAVFKF